MSNRGLLGGLAPATWRHYTPELHATVLPGQAAPTQPALGSDGVAEGRYLVLDGGLVVCQIRFVFGTVANGMSAGSGSDAWMARLPFPAYRWTNALSGGNADLPISTGLARQDPSQSPTFTMPLIPTLGDPFPPYPVQSNEDYYAQFFCAHSLASGTGAVISGTGTSVTVTHGLGTTPTASDIQVVCVAKSGTPAASRQVYVNTITSTQFNINVTTAPGAGTSLTFDWKVRAEPNNSVDVAPLLNHGRPWAWDENDRLSAQLIYEARF